MSIQLSISKEGDVTANSFSGVGTNLTWLNADNILYGTLEIPRLPIVPPIKGGTGLSYLDIGRVLIGNGEDSVLFCSIDSTNGGTADSNELITSGAVFSGLNTKVDRVGDTITGTLILSKSTALSGVSDNRPALLIGGEVSTPHIEVDFNKIQAKNSATTVASLSINPSGGNTYIGDTLSVVGDSTFSGLTTHNNGIKINNTGGSWIAGKTTSKTIMGPQPTVTNSYFPFLHQTSYSGNIVTVGTLAVSNTDDRWGIYIYKSDRTEDGVDFQTYWNTSDGTLTHTSALNVNGLVTLKNQLRFSLFNYNGYPLKVYGGDKNGQGISIGAGAATIVGAGESPKACESLLTATSEQLWLTSDNNIYFYTNCQTIANKVGTVLDKSRQFYPDTTNTGALGTSGNRWANIYATNGNLSGKLTAGSVVVTNDTAYTTSKVRNIRFGTAVPSSLANGEIFIVY